MKSTFLGGCMWVLNFVAVMILSQSVFALSPLQYCERLHARRPANVANSSEVLNVTSTSSTITAGTTIYSVVTKEVKYCKNGDFKYRTEVIQSPIMQSNGNACIITTCTQNPSEWAQPDGQTCQTTNNCSGGFRTCIDGTGCSGGAVSDPSIQ